MNAQETNVKPWWTSKTLITSAVAFGVAVASTFGVVDAEAAAKIEALLVPLIFAFLRIGDSTLTS